MEMRIQTIRLIIKEGFTNIYRNKFMSIASITVVTVSLIILSVILLLSFNLNYNTKILTNQPQMEVFCESELDNTQVKEIEKIIKNNIKVKEYSMVTKKQAFEKAKDLLGNDKDVLEGVDESIMPVSFKITLKNPKETELLVNELKTIKGVKKVSFSSKEIDLIWKLNYWIRVLTGGVLVILFLGSSIIIANTIKLAVFSRKSEITIMRYIGATNWFIRLPFIIEGVIIGFIGSVFASFCVGYGYHIFILNIFNKLSFIKFIELAQIAVPFFLVCCSLGIFVGALGSTISIRRYLKV